MTLPAEPSPSAVFALIASNHVNDLPTRQAQVLVLQAIGLEDGWIANLLHISVATVENHARAGRVRVLPEPLRATRAYAQCWAFCHHSCCLASEWVTWVRAGDPWPDGPVAQVRRD